jgi:signal transduction histidine kinase
MSTDDSTASRPRLLAGLSTRQRWLALDGIVALVGILSSTFAIRPFASPRGPLDIGLGLLASIPIPLRRRWPLVALLATAGSVDALLALGRSPFSESVIFGLAAYSVAAQLPRRAAAAALGATAATLGVSLVLTVIARGHSGVTLNALAGFLPLVVAWVVADQVSYSSRLAAHESAVREQRALLAIQDERIRIARELHDVVAHALAVITVQAGTARRLLAKRPEDVAGALESIESAGRTAQDELDVMLGLMRESAVTPDGLSPTPGLADLKDLLDSVRSTGVGVELCSPSTDRTFSPALELSIFRIVQEALTNVVKHAPGARVSVDLTASTDEIWVEVVDDGPGSMGEWSESAVERGHGIVGMQERARAFGGSLTAEPLPDRGFRVAARIPCGRAP